MKVSSLSAAILCLCLAGCAQAQQTISGFVSDPFQGSPALGLVPIQPDRITERASATKTKIVKPPKPEPAVVRNPEPSLPPWSVPAPKPSRTLRYALPPNELFKRLSQSVYTVTVLGQASQVRSQGSAVAISAREAVTNCHVVSHGRIITLINGNINLRAEVIGADLATDRCFLRAEGELQPVPGFREYDSLLVGETVYTIGSPKGFVNTLGSGLLSGLRADNRTEYIQISAPVSPGSSGGGLFDDRGNLIGVTTFTIRDAQNLNFAIAASHFWK